MAAKRPWLTPDLVLGWKVTKGLEPKHWDKEGAKPGDHVLTAAVVVRPTSIARHTVIIAQSGSGKSFFLGRLIEEILLKTQCRVLILDPNSDFRKIAEAKKAKFWTDSKYRYDRVERRGFLADEPTRADFMLRWKKVTTLLHCRVPNTTKDDNNTRQLQLDWRNFPIDVLADETDSKLRDALDHCHAFVVALADLARLTNQKRWLDERCFFKEALEFCKNTLDADDNVKDDEVVLSALKDAFGSVRVTGRSAGSAGKDENV